MKRPRRQVYTLEGYLKKVKDESVRSDQDVQRLAGQWDSSMVNEIVATVLTDDYIPPIILGEQPINGFTQLYIVDGLQRSTSLVRFRYGNYKITSATENNIVTYLKRREDESGRPVVDENGDHIWDTIEFDIRGNTYDTLPDELKTKFNEYQLETVIHEGCTMEEMSKLVRRYNANKSMNTAQKAFTYVDCFARNIRSIINDVRFFKDCGLYTTKEMTNGTIERIISESYMSVFHLDSWNKNAKKIGQFINKQANDEEFDKLRNYFTRLSKHCVDKYKTIFNSKNTLIFMALFDRFNNLGVEDEKFAQFLDAFEVELHCKEVDGIIFDKIGENGSTKDKAVVIAKIDFLEKLMLEFLHINKEETGSDEEFISSVAGVSVADVEEDMDLYEETLEDLCTNCIMDGSKLLDKDNRSSMLALVAWSYQHDADLEEWLSDYAKRTNTYTKNSKRNFEIMLEDYTKFTKAA